jgi:hypothetical protein
MIHKGRGKYFSDDRDSIAAHELCRISSFLPESYITTIRNVLGLSNLLLKRKQYPQFHSSNRP